MSQRTQYPRCKKCGLTIYPLFKKLNLDSRGLCPVCRLHQSEQEIAHDPAVKAMNEIDNALFTSPIDADVIGSAAKSLARIAAAKLGADAECVIVLLRRTEIVGNIRKVFSFFINERYSNFRMETDAKSLRKAKKNAKKVKEALKNEIKENHDGLIRNEFLMKMELSELDMYFRPILRDGFTMVDDYFAVFRKAGLLVSNSALEVISAISGKQWKDMEDALDELMSILK